MENTRIKLTVIGTIESGTEILGNLNGDFEVKIEKVN